MAASDADNRPHDLVLLGATGFTGGLTAEYLADHAPAELRWALAGRNREKLEQVRRSLTDRNPALAELPLLVADTADPASLADLAGSTRVVATTVGPYLELGEPLVRACAEAGTDYLDLTGEPEFVDRMYVAHHGTALASGARLIHACGFDSIPHDLGAYFAIQHLAAGGEITTPVTMRGVVRAGAQFSGGTFASALTAMSRPRQMRAAMKERKAVEPRPEGRRSKPVQGKPYKDPLLGYWLLPMPVVDPLIVARSGAALSAYGPDFRYSHYAGVKHLPVAVGGVVGVGAMAAAAQVKPVREFLKKRVPQGQGPDERRREKSWFTVDVIGETAGRTVHVQVSGGDPGYTETAKMLAEAAMCVALDENPVSAGQVTTAQAMGDHLLTRLQSAGIQFTVL